VANFEEVFERIKLATGTRTQVEIAEVLDIRQSSISDAKRRDSIPSDWYMKLFEKFGLSPDWLKKGSGPMYLRTDEGYQPTDGPQAARVMAEKVQYADPNTKGVVVNVHGGRCEGDEAAGFRPQVVGKLNVPQSLASESLLVLRFDATSMEPLFKRGAFVGIDTAQKAIVSGEVYGVFVPYEGLTLKRIFMDAENNRLTLCSDAGGHPEMHLPADNFQGRIAGRVVWVMQTV
jgi:phage repressor protein C with HTH and peptisase S24 domain